jgi:hypothetical protein
VTGERALPAGAIAPPAVQIPTFMLEQEAESVIDLDSTAEVRVGRARPALPFAEGSSSLAAPSSTRDVGETEWAKRESPDDALDSTLEAASPLERPLLPFLVRGGGVESSLTTYAALCSNLRAFPARRADILAKFGVADEAHLGALQTAFGEVFQRDPAQRAEFERAYDEHAARLQRRP